MDFSIFQTSWQWIFDNRMEIATWITIIGILPYNQGNYEKALPLYERNLTILQNVFDEQHPLVKKAKNNYESCLAESLEFRTGSPDEPQEKP